MSESLLLCLKRLLSFVVQMPVAIWNRYLLAELKHRDTRRLLRLEPYLLEDMGLRRVDERIEAIDPARIREGAPFFCTQRAPIQNPHFARTHSWIKRLITPVHTLHIHLPIRERPFIGGEHSRQQ